jgi:hypothetical protein
MESLQNRPRFRAVLFLALLLLGAGIGWLAAEKSSYALLGLAAMGIGLVLFWIPTKWLLWATIFFAPVDIYRVEFGFVNLSLYRVFLLAAFASWGIKALPRLRTLRVHPVFTALFGIHAVSTIVWFSSTRYEMVGLGEVFNVSSGLLLIILFYFVFDNYDDWKRTISVFAISGAWVVLGLMYTYGLFISTGQLVIDIPFREIIPFELASSGWLTHRHNVAGVPKLALPFSSPPHLAGFLVALLNLFVAWYLYKPDLGRKRRWLLLYAVLLLMALILTFARSGWLGFAGGLAVIAIDVLRSRRKKPLSVAVWVSILLSLMIVGIVMFVPDSVVESLAARFSIGPDTDLGGHWQTRLDALGIWMTDLRTLFFGVGFSNYVLYGSGIHSHSPYMTVLAERGLVGSFLFWMFYAGACVWVGRRAAVWRRLDQDRFSTLLGVFASTIAVLFGSLFYEYIHRNVIWILFALAAATMHTGDWEVKDSGALGVTP